MRTAPIVMLQNPTFCMAYNRIITVTHLVKINIWEYKTLLYYAVWEYEWTEWEYRIRDHLCNEVCYISIDLTLDINVQVNTLCL